MSRHLDDLSARFRPFAIELLARCVEAGYAVMIINTLRTAEEQAANLAAGVSWTKHSKHLTGDAIDIAPFEQYALHGADKIRWDANDPAWQRIGELGEHIGLTWGGRWRQRDLGHFEYPDPATMKVVA